VLILCYIYLVSKGCMLFFVVFGLVLSYSVIVVFPVVGASVII